MIIQVGHRYAVNVDNTTTSGTVQELAYDTSNGQLGALTRLDDDTLHVIYPTDFVTDITQA